MTSVEAIALLAVGVLLLGGSRYLADHFCIREPPDSLARSIRFAGLADDDWSRLYRWVTSVLVGTVFVVVGLVGLLA